MMPFAATVEAPVQYLKINPVPSV
jgi:hypothetical protein